jgi:hypothetical protein
MVGGALSSLQSFPFNRNRTAVIANAQILLRAWTSDGTLAVQGVGQVEAHLQGPTGRHEQCTLTQQVLGSGNSTQAS